MLQCNPNIRLLDSSLPRGIEVLCRIKRGGTALLQEGHSKK